MTDVGEIPATHPFSELIGKLQASLNGSQVDEDFLTAYARRMPGDYAETVSLDDLGNQIRSVLEFASVRPGNDVLVRVFNPTEETHGYSTPGGVVEIVAPDVAFLVDSVTNELTAAGFGVEAVIHPVVGTVRDADGRLTDIKPARQAATRDSIQHYELDRHVTDDEAASLEAAVRQVLNDVRKTVADFEPMQGAIYRMMKRAKEGGARYSEAEIQEAVAFLEWLLDDHFVFLGFREYQITETDEGRAVAAKADSGLGILSDSSQSKFAQPVLLHTLPEAMRRRYEEGYLVVVTKTNNMSRVHRRARMDYIGIRHIDGLGNVSGETRLLGLFTSKAYMQRAESVPVLRRKLTTILDAEDAIAGSHHYKHIVQLFNSIPKEELFATESEDLRLSILGLIEAQEREGVRIFVRRDVLQRSVSVMVVLPRDRFNADVRRALQNLVLERLEGTSIDYRLFLGEEEETARIHFTVWTEPDRVPTVDIEVLEAEVIDIARSWDERLAGALAERFGDAEGKRLSDTWSHRFPESYRSRVRFKAAVDDVANLDRLAAEGSPVVALRPSRSQEGAVSHISVYMTDRRLDLSEIMPILEHFGLRAIGEEPTVLDGDSSIHIHDFTVSTPNGSAIDVDQCGARVATTITAVLSGKAESDPLARLIISAGLHHRDVAILRAYRTYWQRVGSEFTGAYMNEAMASHPRTSARLIRLFAARFDPENAGITIEAELIDEITSALDRIKSLDEDRILRGFLTLVLATVRTSAYLPDRSSLSFKFTSADVPGMPAPTPLFEIFVYAPDVEGIHLRGGRVARGGLRWSVRREDYRTEVLGLMKAQMTKNAVIVPTGAKGGFVLRGADPQPSYEAVRSAYQTFIRGLLDLTDNRVGGEVIHPDHTVVHDRGDPYLVVAADKGTASFSDTANELAAEYNFWLGDAFASGGSAGYDHKALGITARGGWESVRWQLRELNIDPDHDEFSAVGVGDMSGDVFGNGMMLSPAMKLIAAFDHRHIFIDPEPDPAAALVERTRLFELAGSSWEDYEASLISTGGGVWPRSVKKIDLPPEAAQALGIETTSLTPAEVIQAILRAPVDLLWNGGVGTFVRESDESNAEVGDRNNDAIRVSAAELRVRAVGEGGNLGLTQRARIEFADGGGRVFSDFIDNSGGVNCSDREVNLKILLGLAIERGELDVAGRDELVSQVAPDVVERILYDNFLQAQILSQESGVSAERIEAYEQLMVDLEREGLLDRSIEYLPDSEQLRERASRGEGLLGPELAVLLTYAKRSLTHQLIGSDLPDDPEFDAELAGYFPDAVSERFRHLFTDHPLRRELIATLVANRVINSGGITFVSRLSAESGASADDVVRAYQVGRVVTGAEGRWEAIEDLVGRIDPAIQRDLLQSVDELVEELTRWQLRNDTSRSVTDRVGTYRSAFKELCGGIGSAGPAAWQADRQAEEEQLVALGVPDGVAHNHVYQPHLANGCSIIQVAAITDRPVLGVASVFLSVGSAMHIDWLEDRAEEMAASTSNERQALRVIRDDLGELRRQFAEYILSEGGSDRSAIEAVDHFLVDRTQTIGHVGRFFRGVSADGAPDIATLIVAIRRIEQLIQ